MIRELFAVLAMNFLASQVYATSTKAESSLPSEEFINKKIEEYDAMLSEYLHVPIKKFSSIFTDIADHIYQEELSPLHEEIKHLRQELATVKSDLKDTKNQLRIIAAQVETIIYANKDIQKEFEAGRNLRMGN